MSFCHHKGGVRYGCLSLLPMEQSGANGCLPALRRCFAVRLSAPICRAASARRLPGGTAALRPALLLIRRVRGRRLPASRQLAVGQLVWSIINIVMGFMPLGIAALVMTILAQSADWASQEKRRLRAAMVLNIISSCLLPLVVLLFFALLIGSLAAY